MNVIDSLQLYTIVVTDTVDIDAIAEHKPRDAATNPSLPTETMAAGIRNFYSDARTLEQYANGKLAQKLAS